jgi:ATP-binding cassette subfamily B protein
MRRMVDGAGLVHQLSALVPRLRVRSVGIAGLSFLSSLAEAGMLVSLTAVAESAIRSRDQVELLGRTLDPTSLVWVGIGLLVAKVVLAVAGSWLSVNLAAEVLQSLRQRLTSLLLAAAPLALTRERLGGVQDRLTTWCERVASSTEAYASLLSASMSFVAFVVVAAVLDWRTVAVVIVLGVVVAAAMRPLVRLVRRAAERFRRAANQFAGEVGEATLVAPELSVFGVTDRYGQVLDATGRSAAGSWRNMRMANMLLPHTYQTLALGLLFLAVLLASSTQAGVLATWGAVVLLLVRGLGSGQQIVTYRGQLISTAPFVAGVTDEISRLEAAANPPGSVRVDSVRTITFDDVTFGYGTEPAVRGIDVEIPFGTSLAVVGPSGAGKTTFARLLLRQARATSGSVEIDGVDVFDVRREDWARLCAPVAQQPMMVTGTILDNVRFYRDIEAVAVHEACRSAHILDEILALPEGFETPIDPGGGALSGGQRQRLALARALAGRPELIVLDEPTSALDVESERRISAALNDLKGDVTTVVIAHRWSTVAHCDRVLVLVEGRIEAVGDIETASAASSFLRQMREAGWDRQPHESDEEVGVATTGTGDVGAD